MEKCEKQLFQEGKLRDDLVSLLPSAHFFPRFFGRKPSLDYLGSFESDIKVVFGYFPSQFGPFLKEIIIKEWIGYRECQEVPQWVWNGFYL